MYQYLVQLLLCPRGGPVHEIEPWAAGAEPPDISVAERALADRAPGCRIRQFVCQLFTNVGNVRFGIDKEVVVRIGRTDATNARANQRDSTDEA